MFRRPCSRIDCVDWFGLIFFLIAIQSTKKKSYYLFHSLIKHIGGDKVHSVDTKFHKLIQNQSTRMLFIFYNIRFYMWMVSVCVWVCVTCNEYSVCLYQNKILCASRCVLCSDAQLSQDLFLFVWRSNCLGDTIITSQPSLIKIRHNKTKI